MDVGARGTQEEEEEEVVDHYAKSLDAKCDLFFEAITAAEYDSGVVVSDVNLTPSIWLHHS